MKGIEWFIHVARRDGFRPAVRRAISVWKKKRARPGMAQSKRDVISFWSSVLGEEHGLGLKLTRENVPAGSMTWVIPDFTASSGGHINILRMMQLLNERGFPQHVVIMEPHRWASTESAQSALNQSFGVSGITVSLGIRSIEPSRFLVATSWQTAYWVAKYKDAVHRLYFVQDFEPTFYAHSSEYVFAENTYKLGLTGLTAGPWLAEKLRKEYGMTTFPYSFASDLSLYEPRPKRPHARRHIFFYARPVTPRRCFEIGLLALNEVCRQVPDVAVIFAGWNVDEYEIPFHHLNAGTVALAELADLYSQCDVALILSATNLSLLPLEVAACGCPIVMNNGPYSSWCLSADEAFYCDLSVEGVAKALIDVLGDPVRAAEVAEAALRRARASSWNDEADKIAGYLAAMDEDEQQVSHDQLAATP